MMAPNQHPYSYITTVAASLGSADDKQDGSTSGIMIDSQQGLILTHASLLYPFVEHFKPGNLDRLRSHGVLDKNCLNGKLNIEVIIPNSNILGGSNYKEERRNNKINIHPSLLNCNVQEMSSYSRYKGSLQMVFECKNLRRTLENVTSNDNWKFVDDTNNDQKDSNKKKSNNTTYDEIAYLTLLPCFVLIKLQNISTASNTDNSWHADSLSLRPSLENQIGDPVEICATPFAALSPDVFLNSHSRGIVSNIAGPGGVLLMTDARCIPGSEGGALFYCQGQHRMLTGIMIASLCWKSNEWVGLSLACAISEVLGSLGGHLTQDPGPNLSTVQYMNSQGSSSNAKLVSKLLQHVVYVRVGHSWGSGVSIDHVAGVYLTCSHVLRGVEHSGVHVSNDGLGTKSRCDVVYRVPGSQQFDIAIIQSQRQHMQGTRKVHSMDRVQFGRVDEGDVVYVIGHAIFRNDLHLPPTVTRGIVSKVIVYNKVPVMIQTTCAVHAGASGGGVFNKWGHLVAIVVCNSKDTVSGACYPHVNMCVPMETLAPVITEYLKSNDKSVLKSLYISNQRINHLWSMGTEGELTVSKL